MAATLGQVHLVHRPEQVELFALRFECQCRVVDVSNDRSRIHLRIIDLRSLIDSRQKSIPPQRGANDRFSGTQHDKAWQVFVFGSESVEQPRAHRWTSRLGLAAGHHQQRRFMIRNIGMHRTDHTKVIRAAAKVWKQFADFKPRLTMFVKTKRRFHQSARFSLRLFFRSGRPLPIVLRQLRLGIKRIDLARPAIHEQMNDPLGSRREHRWLGRKRIGCCRNIARARERRITSERTGQAQRPHSGAESMQHFAT